MAQLAPSHRTLDRKDPHVYHNYRIPGPKMSTRNHRSIVHFVQPEVCRPPSGDLHQLEYPNLLDLRPKSRLHLDIPLNHQN